MKMVVAKAKLQLNSQQLTGGQHDQTQGATGGGYGQTRTPRQPFCFYCKNQGSDQYNHWPNRCELLGSVISGYHQEQAKTGHTNNK